MIYYDKQQTEHMLLIINYVKIIMKENQISSHSADSYPRRPDSLKLRWIEVTESISLYKHTDIL